VHGPRNDRAQRRGKASRPVDRTRERDARCRATRGASPSQTRNESDNEEDTMDPAYRKAFNAAYSPDTYQRYQARLEQEFGMKVPFRVAETPLFLPRQLRQRLVDAATGIVEKISEPALIDRLSDIVPRELEVPRRDDLCACIQVDLAITRDAQGELDCKLIELQGFPSLYAFTVYQTLAMSEILRAMPGLDHPWTCYFGGLDTHAYVQLLRRAIVADCDPAEVILMDLDPPSQKTYPDFLATRRLLGVDAVCPTTLRREGPRLFREVSGKLVPVKRIFNRVVFDELLNKGISLPFAYSDDLDVTWVPHPNWYWIWSKYTIPHIEHPAVPRSRLLSTVERIPDDLSNYILKPLFSFAGSGVRIDVTRADIDGIPERERSQWLLQERITYAPALQMPDGNGVKAEVRMMFLRAPGEPRPRLVMNLSRLSRGKMHGVDHNKDLDWVGGTVGIFPADEA
jgi:hypothetical protein